MRDIEANFHVKVSLKILRWMGAWPTEDRYRYIYVLYSVFCFIFINGIYLFVQSANMIFLWGDVERLVAVIPFIMTNMVFAFKLFNIWWLQARIRGLLQFIKSEVLCRYYLLYKDISRSYTLSGIFHHIAYQSFGAIGCICLGLIPIADVIAGHGRRLPVEGWYPYNYTRTPAFEFTCAHQTIAILAGCIENVAMDTLVTGFITVACCQLEFLKSNLRRVGVDSLKSANCFHEEVDKELRNCVKHHIAIIEFTNEIQGIFGNMIFLQFLSNCMIICLIAFHITKMKLFVPAELMGMGLYICCVTYQIFIYCWHGNEIMLQSESVVFAAYSGNWWRFGERYKRGLRLLMARANRPLTLTAGNLLTLSLETFVAILRASYSFFTVLQSSTDKTQT